MARIQCSCGRAYSVPDDSLGKQVKCAACNRTFVAYAAAPPKERGEKGTFSFQGDILLSAPKGGAEGRFAGKQNVPLVTKARPPKAPPRKPPARPVAAPSRSRLGELAVARGLLTRQQLSACLRYLEDIRRLPGQEDLRLGGVLVSKGLLTKAQVNGLLKEQSGDAAATAAAAVDLSPRALAAGQAVTDEQREAVRRSVDAAMQKQAEREAATTVEAARVGFLDRIRRTHVMIAGGVLLALLLAFIFWPDPPAKRVLVAYLESCNEDAVSPDRSLEIVDLNLRIREFGDVRLLPSASYDFTEELAAFAKEQDLADDWWELLGAVPMPDGKYEALDRLVPALPEELTPTKIGSLQITVQPATCHMVSKQGGMAMYAEGTYRFLVLKAHSPMWQIGWQVAACEPVALKAAR